MTATTREELALAIDVAEWEWLKPHLERSALIYVSRQLDLADTAYKVATDDSIAINGWIADGSISKPSGEQIADWNAAKHLTFSMVIISPYILIQERPPADI